MHPSISKGFYPPLSFAVQAGVNQEFNFVVYSTLLTDKRERLKELLLDGKISWNQVVIFS